MVALLPTARPLPAATNDLRMAVRDFVASDQRRHEWTPRVDSWISAWDPEFSRRLAGQGWVGMTIPKEFGGQGMSHVERFVVTEEVLAAGAPVAAHWVADRQVAPALLAHGSDALKARYLPAIASGECYFAIGMSEPESGSDLASVATRGRKVTGGWEVTGTKVWTSGAHHSDAFFVLARTADLDPAHRHDGLSQFLVPLDSPGIEIRPIRLLTGQHHFNEVVLDKVFVPDEMVVGSIGSGWHQVTSELGYERSGPERLLSAHPMLEETVNTMQRSEDVHPVGTVELGGLVSDLIALRTLSSTVAQELADGKPAELGAALVKDVGTAFEQRVVAVCADIGSSRQGVEDSYPELTRIAAEGLNHSPGFTLRGGTSEILRGVIARGLGLR